MTESEGFNGVFDIVGSFGPFQLLLLLCITLQALTSYHHLSYVFLGAVPPHWCFIEELKSSGWSQEQIRNISIPSSESIASAYSWEPCVSFNLNYTDLLISSNNSYEFAYASIHSQNNERLIKTQECSAWTYDSSVYASTVVTQFDLVCNRRILVGTIQGTYMLGVLVGSVILGSLSDQLLGRRRSVLISTVITILGGFATGFVTTYELFILFRFIVAAGVAGSYQNCYVLMLEYSNTASRAFFGLLGQLSFAIGYMIVALLGFYFRSWSELQLALATLSLILISYFWILPESARWLVYKGQDERAFKLLKIVARLNRKTEPDKEVLFEIFKTCRDEANVIRSNESCNKYAADRVVETDGIHWAKLVMKNVKVTFGNYWRLLKTPEIRKRTLLIWFLFIIVDLVYYGVVFDSATLTSDPYLIVFLAGLMEVPAYTLVVPCLTSLGRRPTVVGTFFLTALASFAVAYAPIEYQVFRVVVSMCGKLFITTCFAVLYLLGAELFPTATRTTGLASAVLMGRLGSVMAPYIVDLMKTVYRDLPNIIFGLVSVVAALIAILLPETKDAEMFDDIRNLEKSVVLSKSETKDEKSRANANIEIEAESSKV